MLHKKSPRVHARGTILCMMLEIPLRERARDVVFDILLIIAARMHRWRLGLVRDLGLLRALLGISPRARTRDAILCAMLEIAACEHRRGLALVCDLGFLRTILGIPSRARTRDAIPCTMLEISLRARAWSVIFDIVLGIPARAHRFGLTDFVSWGFSGRCFKSYLVCAHGAQFHALCENLSRSRARDLSLGGAL